MAVARIRSERLWTGTGAPGIGERQCKSAASSGLGVRQSLGQRSLECNPAVCWVSGSGGSATNSGVAGLQQWCGKAVGWRPVESAVMGESLTWQISNRGFTSSSSGNLAVKRSVSGSAVVQRSQAGA
ncbi:hypothetical protein FH972_010117 [Carpinus fangiana]|uniref:Uncharacterized protein n=1 Tax=Carpinus fangiana TaxID=176857 RepID=A0A660KQF1_9ROSI|nr:hypothetical protein FH972_010117 [Carpinus fangiana]